MSEEVNVAYPKVDWDSVLPPLPVDEDGFVQSFDIVMAGEDEKIQQQNKQNIQDFFNRYGVVVIRNVLDQKEAELSCNEVFDYVEKNFDGLDRNDPNTWDKIYGLSAKLGMITDWPVMTPQLVKNRINPKLYTAYSYILDTDIDNIYTNIGRVGWMRPTRNIKFDQHKTEDRIVWKTQDGATWLHQDYDPLSNHCTTYGLMPRKAVKAAKVDTFHEVRTQGILALDDCRPTDGGFQCIPGFHNIMNEVWLKEYGRELIQKGCFQHRYQFKRDDPLIQYVTKCPLKKGSFLVWNSKLPHNNFSNDSDHGRMVQYIKYARYDDPAVKPVKFGVEQVGPWGWWPLTLEFPEEVELNKVTKRIYGIGVPDVDGDIDITNQDQNESEQDDESTSWNINNCTIL